MLDHEAGRCFLSGGYFFGVIAGGRGGEVFFIGEERGLGVGADGEDAVGAEDVDSEEGGLDFVVGGIVELDGYGVSGLEDG